MTITVTNANLPGEAGEYDAYHNEAIYRDEATVGVMAYFERASRRRRR